MSADPGQPGRPGEGLLKMSELAESSGVSTGTIKHYLREGLLPEPVKTSRNMAYYPPDFVERIRLIKRLQEQRFLPLKRIKAILAAAGDGERPRLSRAEAARRHNVPRRVLERLEEIGVLSGDRGGYEPDDVQIVQAIAGFRSGGWDEAIGFTVYDTLRYREALEPLVREEVRLLLERLPADVDAERALGLVASGREPLRELLGAMHSKLLLAELRRQAGGV